MVKLRLRRKGKSHKPFYDIIAVDGRKKRDGAYLERLGWYNPHTQPTTFKINSDRAIYWMNVGAQPSDIVMKLMKYDGILLRRALQFKNTPEEEINTRVEKHKEDATARYWRLKEKRKQRKDDKIKAEADAKAAEEAAANAPAEEAPAEEAPAE